MPQVSHLTSGVTRSVSHHQHGETNYIWDSFWATTLRSKKMDSQSSQWLNFFHPQSATRNLQTPRSLEFLIVSTIFTLLSYYWKLFFYSNEGDASQSDFSDPFSSWAGESCSPSITQLSSSIHYPDCARASRIIWSWSRVLPLVLRTENNHANHQKKAHSNLSDLDLSYYVSSNHAKIQIPSVESSPTCFLRYTSDRQERDRKPPTAHTLSSC